MALVSYDVSDASGSENEDDIQAEPIANKIDKKHTSSSSAGKSSENGLDEHSKIFSAVPSPKSTLTIVDSDNLKKLLHNKPGPLTAGKPERKIVKIAVPSLSEFEDDLPRPLAKVAAKGSGLFSLLPPPKNSGAAATLKFMPDSLKKPAAPKPVLKPPVRLPKPPIAPPVAVDPPEDNDSDDDSCGDFFSLNKPKEPEPIVDLPTEILIPSVDASPQLPTPINDVVEENDNQYSADDYISVSQDSLELDDEALQRLCGGNKRKRNAFQAQLIDVSEKDVVPDKKEWLMKALTEEKRTRSHKKGVGPSSTQKRKHQITYLAHQAKEQEQDLQNQWATNRMTKKQTQSKYGF